MERDGNAACGSECDGGFGLEARSSLRPRKFRAYDIPHVETKVVVAEPRLQVQATLDKIESLLNVAGRVGYMGVGARGDACGIARRLWIESHIDLIRVEVVSRDEERSSVFAVLVMSIYLALQPGIVLL